MVVDAACFVALGAENVKAAERDHFVVFRFTLRGELLVNGKPLVGRNLKNFAFILEEDHQDG